MFGVKKLAAWILNLYIGFLLLYLVSNNFQQVCRFLLLVSFFSQQFGIVLHLFFKKMFELFFLWLSCLVWSWSGHVCSLIKAFAVLKVVTKMSDDFVTKGLNCSKGVEHLVEHYYEHLFYCQQIMTKHSSKSSLGVAGRCKKIFYRSPWE